MQSDGRIVLMNQAEIHDFIPFSGGGLSRKIRRQIPLDVRNFVAVSVLGLGHVDVRMYCIFRSPLF